MKILYVGYHFNNAHSGGELVRQNNYEAICELAYPVDQFIIHNDTNKINLFKNTLKLSFNGGSKKVVRNFKHKITQNQYSHVFFDGSLFGSLIRLTKKYSAKTKVLTLFHNIEWHYYQDRLKKEPTLNQIILPSIWQNEKLSIQLSDEIICLTQRDKNYILKQRSEAKVSVAPIHLKDQFNPNKTLAPCQYDYLFIGSNFYANAEGISWFIKQVLPFVKGKLLVVGNGMEKLQKKFKSIPKSKLEILGRVDDLEPYYYQKNIIISPIFSGSGMKTKTVEALMYGKNILATQEALIGIEANELPLSAPCQSAEDFINSINQNNFDKGFNVNNRKIYESNHTKINFIKTLEHIL